mmetsp:Transcript_4298/g.8230  ORF Transcript_4298/g.8230 Transcript_4298/m.8230 type:complete len:82 (+) Transcript_4298:524-769(+)
MDTSISFDSSCFLKAVFTVLDIGLAKVFINSEPSLMIGSCITIVAIYYQFQITMLILFIKYINVLLLVVARGSGARKSEWT